MDPAHRAFLAIGIAVFLKVLIVSAWDRFKAREALKPSQMRMRNGIYVEWGTVQKIEAFGRVMLKIGIAWLLLCVGAVIYMKAMGWTNLF